MTCRELADFIADYLSEALPGDTRTQFEHHLGDCSNCVMYLDGYRQAIRPRLRTAYRALRPGRAGN